MSGRTLGNFELHELLGEGAMGQVYRAVDLNLDRPVAVKLLSSRVDFDPSFSDRFKREARLAAKLNHPNIATIYAFGEDGGEAYIAMEFVEGMTLDELLKSRALSYAEIRKYGIQVASALELAHSMGIVHRDIKSSNLMINPAGDIKVMDFGVARRQGETHLTMEGGLVGTANIMAPEIIRGEEATPASDLFSLGCVLYEVIAGQPAFTGENAMAVLYNIMHEVPLPVGATRAEIPPDLVEVVTGLLRKDPQTRLGPARAVVDILSGAAPALETPVGPQREKETLVLSEEDARETTLHVRPSRKSWKSNPRLWGGAAAGAVVVVAVAVMMLGGEDNRAQAVALNDTGVSWMQQWNGTNQAVLDSAEVYLQRAADRDQDFASPLSNLGKVYKDQGKHDQAIDVLNRAIARDSDFAGAHANLAEVFDAQGRYREAVGKYRQALWLATDQDTALKISCWNNLGYLWVHEIDPPRPDTALVVLEDAVQLASPSFWSQARSAALYKNQGRALELLERYEEARTAFLRALEINPSYSPAIEGTVRVRAALNDSI